MATGACGSWTLRPERRGRRWCAYPVRPRSCWWFVLGVMVALGLACAAPQTATGTAGLPSTNPYPDRQTLLADPASTIRMPGADELRPVGAERRTTPEGYAPPFEGGTF